MNPRAHHAANGAHSRDANGRNRVRAKTTRAPLRTNPARPRSLCDSQTCAALCEPKPTERGGLYWLGTAHEQQMRFLLISICLKGTCAVRSKII